MLSIVGLTPARARSRSSSPASAPSLTRPSPASSSSDRSTSATARPPTRHEYISVLARHDGTFNFVLPPEDLSRGLYFPFPRPSDESDSTWPFRVSEGAQPSLDNMPLKQGQLATAQIDGQLERGARRAGRPDGRSRRADRMVTNRTGGRLSDAYIVVDSDFRPLGTLEKDQSSQIDFLLPPQAAAGNLAATAIADKLTPPGSSGRPGRLGAARLARIAVLGALPVRAHGDARADAGRLARAGAEPDHRAGFPPEHGRFHAAGPAAAAAVTALASKVRCPPRR